MLKVNHCVNVFYYLLLFIKRPDLHDKDSISTVFYQLKILNFNEKHSLFQVFIQVENENDNVPLTDEAVYYPTVPESSPAGTKVLQLEAFDSDIDPLQKLTYRITSGNPEGFFAINSTSGKCESFEFFYIFFITHVICIGHCQLGIEIYKFLHFLLCWLENGNLHPIESKEGLNLFDLDWFETKTVRNKINKNTV